VGEWWAALILHCGHFGCTWTYNAGGKYFTQKSGGGNGMTQCLRNLGTLLNLKRKSHNSRLGKKMRRERCQTEKEGLSGQFDIAR